MTIQCIKVMHQTDLIVHNQMLKLLPHHMIHTSNRSLLGV